MNIKNSKIKKVRFGKNCIITKPVNLYECELGNNVFVGPFVEIQKNAFIGDNTRISSHTFICELVKIGINCFIGHGVMFTNCLLKNRANKKFIKNYLLPTFVGDNVCIGSNSTILPVKISDNIIIGAGSVVVDDLLKEGIYAGNPAKLIKKNYKKNIY